MAEVLRDIRDSQRRMNGGFVIGPKTVQEVRLEVNVNRNMSRLPVIVIQTPAEVEAGLFSNCSGDENAQSQRHCQSSTEDENDFNLSSWKRKPEIWNYQEVAESRPAVGLSTDRARNIRSFRFSRNSTAGIEVENEWKVRMAARKGRWSRSKAKKSTASEQKRVMEDALFAFKKMRLNCEETDDHTMD